MKQFIFLAIAMLILTDLTAQKEVYLRQDDNIGYRIGYKNYTYGPLKFHLRNNNTGMIEESFLIKIGDGRGYSSGYFKKEISDKNIHDYSVVMVYDKECYDHEIAGIRYAERMKRQELQRLAPYVALYNFLDLYLTGGNFSTAIDIANFAVERINGRNYDEWLVDVIKTAAEGKFIDEIDDIKLKTIVASAFSLSSIASEFPEIQKRAERAFTKFTNADQKIVSLSSHPEFRDIKATKKRLDTERKERLAEVKKYKQEKVKKDKKQGVKSDKDGLSLGIQLGFNYALPFVMEGEEVRGNIENIDFEYSGGIHLGLDIGFGGFKIGGSYMEFDSENISINGARNKSFLEKIRGFTVGIGIVNKKINPDLRIFYLKSDEEQGSYTDARGGMFTLFFPLSKVGEGKAFQIGFFAGLFDTNSNKPYKDINFVNNNVGREKWSTDINAYSNYLFGITFRAAPKFYPFD